MLELAFGWLFDLAATVLWNLAVKAAVRFGLMSA